MDEKEIPLDIAKKKTYVVVWLCLLILTATTVTVAKLHVTDYAVVAAIFIASVKAGLVVTFFMHLRQEPWILKIMLFVALGALTLIVLLTFSDVWYRY
jgi:cytochrome c oxidase subunit 4